MFIGIRKVQSIITIFHSQCLEQEMNTSLFGAHIENALFQYIANEPELAFEGFPFLFCSAAPLWLVHYLNIWAQC